MRAAALRRMAACSLLFVVVYNLCNWITAHRSDVGSWFYPWELKLPFLPWMIFPYWSLDLFFVFGFFICTSQRELETLGRRLILAILLAGSCFLLIPLTTAFPRPQVSGVSGELFNALRSFDQPHNLFPSLHIAFRTLLAAHYARHLRGILRWVSHGWFSLIGCSTLFTYQHHVVDILGGFGLAVLCFYLFREAENPAPPAVNQAVGRRYASATVAALLLAWITLPWGAWFLWPALGLGITASAYFGLGSKIYRKEAGTLPLSSRIVLAPVLWGHWISFLHYRRQCRPWDEVSPGVMVGRRLSAGEASTAIREGVVAVLDLTAESPENPLFLALPYRNLPILDLTAPTQGQLHDGIAFITEHCSRGKVYVHCKIGYSRSAAMAAAFLLDSGREATLDSALARLRAARPSIVVRPEILEALSVFGKGQEPPTPGSE